MMCSITYYITTRISDTVTCNIYGNILTSGESIEFDMDTDCEVCDCFSDGTFSCHG